MKGNAPVRTTKMDDAFLKAEEARVQAELDIVEAIDTRCAKEPLVAELVERLLRTTSASYNGARLLADTLLKLIEARDAR